MKMHQFVSGSAVLIAGWLMVTFFHEVPSQQYPPQRRAMPLHAAKGEPAKFGAPPHAGGPETSTTLAASLPR